MATLLRVPQVKPGVERALPASATPHGARVMDIKPAPGDNPGDYPNPTNVFLIYITQVAVNRWAARHMYSQVILTPENTAEILFNVAKIDDTSSPFRVGNSFINLVWNEPCYLYLVLDLDHADFEAPNAPEHDPIRFLVSKPILGSNPVVYQNYDANHSFYNGTITEVGGQSAFRCINYFKDENGNNLQYPQVRFYGFEIRFVVTYEDGTKRPHDIDPDGQNQGPPSRLLELEILAA